MKKAYICIYLTMGPEHDREEGKFAALHVSLCCGKRKINVFRSESGDLVQVNNRQRKFA